MPCSVENRGDHQFTASFLPENSQPHNVEMTFNDTPVEGETEGEKEGEREREKEGEGKRGRESGREREREREGGKEREREVKSERGTGCLEDLEGNH